MLKNLLRTLLLLVLTSPLSAQLSGTLIVDPNGGGDFTSLSAAAAALNSQGMAGNVTLKLATALYAEQVLFDIPGQTANQMLTIESQTGNGADVVFRFEEAVEDTNYQLAFTEIKALTIQNISINTSGLDYGAGIRLIGECSNVLIDNLHHDGNNDDPGVVGHYHVGFSSDATPVHDITIINSYFHLASPSIGVGVGFFNVPTSGPSTNLNFHNNTFFDANGIYVQVSENVTIENNVFYGEEYRRESS